MSRCDRPDVGGTGLVVGDARGVGDDTRSLRHLHRLPVPGDLPGVSESLWGGHRSRTVEGRERKRTE